MYDRILYPTVRDEETGDVLESVHELAETHDATVHILHVVDAKHVAIGIGRDPTTTESPGMAGDPSGGDVPMVGDREPSQAVRRKAREYGKQLVDETAHRLDGVDTRTAILGGDPAQVIASYAEQHDTDVVMMVKRDRPGLARCVFGSVTETVVRLTDIPVLVLQEGNEYTVDIDGTVV